MTYPDPKLHAFTQLVDLFNKRLQTIWEPIWIDNPITQSSIIIHSRMFTSKPTIIHDKHLYSQITRRTGNLVQLFGREIEIRSFPIVDQTRSVLVDPRAGDQVVSV
jgi:hypothetical protein